MSLIHILAWNMVRSFEHRIVILKLNYRTNITFGITYCTGVFKNKAKADGFNMVLQNSTLPDAP